MTRETSFGIHGESTTTYTGSNIPNHNKGTSTSAPSVSFYKNKEHVNLVSGQNSQVNFNFFANFKFQGCRHQRYDDTLKRKRKQSMIGKHYSTWHDKVISKIPFSTSFYFVSEAPKFENLFFFVFLITLLKSSDFNDLDYISGNNIVYLSNMI